MDAVRKNFCSLLRDESGATAIEYGLIAALIVIAMMGGLRAMGGGANGMWGGIDSDISNVM